MKQVFKQASLLMLVLLTFTTAFAQPGNRQQRMEKIKSIKVGFITDRLHLTSDQATKFWPVYNKYEEDLRSVRRSFFQQYKDQRKNMDEETSKRFIEDHLEYQEEELKIKKKYKNEMLKVISAQQLAELYQAERDFRKMLVNELKERRMNHQRKPQH